MTVKEEHPDRRDEGTLLVMARASQREVSGPDRALGTETSWSA